MLAVNCCNRSSQGQRWRHSVCKTARSEPPTYQGTRCRCSSDSQPDKSNNKDRGRNMIIWSCLFIDHQILREVTFLFSFIAPFLFFGLRICRFVYIFFIWSNFGSIFFLGFDAILTPYFFPWFGQFLVPYLVANFGQWRTHNGRCQFNQELHPLPTWFTSLLSWPQLQCWSF